MCVCVFVCACVCVCICVYVCAFLPPPPHPFINVLSHRLTVLFTSFITNSHLHQVFIITYLIEVAIGMPCPISLNIPGH